MYLFPTPCIVSTWSFKMLSLHIDTDYYIGYGISVSLLATLFVSLLLLTKAISQSNSLHSLLHCHVYAPAHSRSRSPLAMDQGRWRLSDCSTVCRLAV